MSKKQTGMLFNAEMVLAILDGRKTQTRRPIDRIKGHGKVSEFQRSTTHVFDFQFRYRRCLWQDYRAVDFLKLSPHGGVGDLIWGRETFRKGVSDYGLWVVQYKADDQVLHMVATENGEGDIVGVGSLAYSFFPPEAKWVPSTHMPMWASRLWLEITNVRVERVNAITERDAIAEGFTGVAAFTECWVSLYGQDSWDKGWCWVYDFKRVKRPEA